MKTRNGFVSNSSSSSFLILGKQVEIHALTLDDIDKGIIVTGREFGEGFDAFKVTSKAMLNFVLKNEAMFCRAFTDAKMVNCDSGTVCESWMVGKEMYYAEVSMHSSVTLKDLQERYKDEN